MSFLGPVTQLSGHLIRPHDIQLLNNDGVLGAVPGVVTRLVRVGFEVRLQVRPTVGNGDAEEVAVTVTRTTARNLGLDVGHHVWMVATRGATMVPVMSREREVAPREVVEVTSR
jgi:sulfate transport system ATP-binding protein